jgi:hypothetical protein
MRSFAAESRMPPAPATQLVNQPAIVVRPLVNVTLRRSRLAENPAEPTFRDLVRPQANADRFHGPTASLGAYQFGRAASRRI